jgi:hypothetical protein
VVTSALDHSKPAMWVSEGRSNLFNRIFSGIIGKRGETSMTFEVQSNLLKKPDDVVIKWGSDK